MVAGFIAGVVPASVAFGSLRQQLTGHITQDETNFSNIKERLQSDDKKLDELLVAVTTIRNDVKWLRDNGGNRDR